MGSLKKLKDKTTTAVRQNIEDRIQTAFGKFTRKATEEEKRFILEVLLNWESETRGSPTDDRCTIAWAFEEEIHRRGHYICIDDKVLLGATLKFLEDYRKGPAHRSEHEVVYGPIPPRSLATLNGLFSALKKCRKESCELEVLIIAKLNEAFAEDKLPFC